MVHTTQPPWSAASGREFPWPVLRYPPGSSLVGPTSTCEGTPHMSAGSGLAKKLDMDDSEVIAPVTPGLRTSKSCSERFGDSNTSSRSSLHMERHY